MLVAPNSSSHVDAWVVPFARSSLGYPAFQQKLGNALYKRHKLYMVLCPCMEDVLNQAQSTFVDKVTNFQLLKPCSNFVPNSHTLENLFGLNAVQYH